MYVEIINAMEELLFWGSTMLCAFVAGISVGWDLFA